MSEGGQLKIATSFESVNRRIKIKFSDTGAGISPNQQDQIFTPFFTTKQRGTGLGLAIVKQIILEHNGKIEVNSVVGKGTTFKIFLPLNDERLFSHEGRVLYNSQRGG